MNKFMAIYKGKKLIIEAETLYKAQQRAAIMFKVERKPWEVAIMAIEVGGKEVIHSTSAL
jgi:hypothetical protein